MAADKQSDDDGANLDCDTFFGSSDRCQYWHDATGFGSTRPAVYAACQMSRRFTRRVISCACRDALEPATVFSCLRHAKRCG
jgi:hypothetical protein